MGLFGGNAKREFESALESLRVNVGLNYRHYEGVAASSAVASSVQRVRETAAQLECTGKRSEVIDAVRAAENQTPPATALGAGPDAQAEIERIEALVREMN